MANQKLDRAEMEKKYQQGEGRLMRDFSSLKELFTVWEATHNLSSIFSYFRSKRQIPSSQHKLNLQDQTMKQLRKQQKDLKESAGAMTNQKSIFKVTYLSLSLY